MAQEQEKCRTCKYWYPEDPDTPETSSWGNCFRFPPTRMGRNTSKPYGIGELTATRPILNQNDWCGEYSKQGDRK